MHISAFVYCCLGTLLVLVSNGDCHRSVIKPPASPSPKTCALKKNEIYIDGGSPCQNTCAALNSPCNIKTKAPEKACYCINGYARDKSGVCIKINSKQCQSQCTKNAPPPPPSKASCALKKNEIYIDGGSACQTTCATLNKPCAIRPIAPVKACYCINGYARNKNGICIKINSKQCQSQCSGKVPPPTPSPPSKASCALKKNEVYIDGGSACQTTCARLNQPCNIKPRGPVKACFCINGYARNKNGVCIKINSKQCQSQCTGKVSPPPPSEKTCALKKNEIYINGGSACQTTCATLNKPCAIRPIAPVKACYCINGYARNKLGVCIKINSKQCQSQCSGNAPPPPPSKASCALKKNEVYIDGGSACQTTCARLNQPCNIKPIGPVKACYCINGYARNKNGVCIKINSNQCQSQCSGKAPPPPPPSKDSCARKKNEVYIDGGSACQTTCATLNKPCAIRPIAPVKACYCINGYARNKMGVCIKINSKQCQSQCSGNAPPPPPPPPSKESCARKRYEIYKDGASPCQTTCATLNQPCAILTKAPVKGCYCIDGYARNKSGVCIKINSKQCQNQCSGNAPPPPPPPPSKDSCARKKNEVYIDDGSACQTTCATLNQPCLIRTLIAVKACYCINGYARNKNGVCIKINSKQCQSQCSNKSPRPLPPRPLPPRPVPSSLPRPSVPLPRPLPPKPLPRPSLPLPRPLPRPIPRPLPLPPRPHPPVPPTKESCARKKNEIYKDGASPCQTTCATLNQPCAILTKAPVKGCYCIDGYARNKSGICIKINSKQCQSQCKGNGPQSPNPPPSKDSCARKKNEVYIDGGSPCQTTCSNLNKPCLIRTLLPVKACYCINGYARNKNGVCIKINSKQCQSQCSGNTPLPPSPKSCALKKNEIYIDGGSACQTTCARLNQPCNIRPIGPVKACYCINGYARNKMGICIKINSKQCQSQCSGNAPPPPPSKASCALKKNEVYIDGGSACQTTCARLNQPCNIRPIGPVKACYCTNGYARNKMGICIKINSKQCQSQCSGNAPPPPPSKASCALKKNEVYIDGGSACQTTCATLNKPCLIRTLVAVKACYCINGYARNKMGICIKINSKQCQSQCSGNAPPPPPSKASCALKKNEVYIDGGSACQTTCATLNKPCAIRPIAPVKACYCINGYARNKMGVCIKINSKQCQSQCSGSGPQPPNPPPSKASCALKKNEVYIDGGSPCQTTCSNLNKPCLIRTLLPVKACYCINGYARNKNGVCIKINSKQCQSQCSSNTPPLPSPKTCALKKNEIYIDGGSACQTTCAKLNQPCAIRPIAPVKACYCINGYARNINGVCIKINSKQCQSQCTIKPPTPPPSKESCAKKKNEIYIAGGSPCQTTCNTLNQACNIQTYVPVNACYCINGYARNKLGVCVKINSAQCQNICTASPPEKPSPVACAKRQNEKYIAGGSPCQRRCNNLNQVCNIKTFAPVNACYCIDGYARDKSGVCIKINSDQCQGICVSANPPPKPRPSVPPPKPSEPSNPSPKTCARNPNEEYIKVGSPCQTTCKNLNKKCYLKSMPRPGCYCINGYARDKSGVCVKINSKGCQQICTANQPTTPPVPSDATCKAKANEQYIEGGSPCQATCDSLNKACTKLPPTKPIKACYCINGYARDKSGVCVKINSKGCQQICSANQPTEPPVPSNATCAAKANEQYIVGGSPCQTTCDTLNHACEKALYARPVNACFCINGYARNKSGICIKINSKQCQSICKASPPEKPNQASCAKKQNEIYIAGGSPCQRTCNNLNKICNIQTFAPVNACYCIDGYARDNTGKCIKINSEQCQGLCTSANPPTGPSPAFCAKKPNEQYEAMGSPCQTTCGTLNQQCFIKRKSGPGCYCINGYARNKSGVCVKINSKGCQQICAANQPTGPSNSTCAAKANEHYTEGGSLCQATCDSLNKACRKMPTHTPIKACYCNNGYARNKSGVCVRINSKECQQICAASQPPEPVNPSPAFCARKPNEQYIAIGSPCQTTCDTLNQQCFLKRKSGPGCYCINGYARNKSGVCVKINSKGCQQICAANQPTGPSNTTCAAKANEQYIEGGSPCQATCDSLNTPCTKLPPKTPIKDCYCINGYARDKSGVCIRINSKQCQTICADSHPTEPPPPSNATCAAKPNEQYIVQGSPCQTTCETLNWACEKALYARPVNACFCTNGYARNKLGVCIRINSDECQQICADGPPEPPSFPACANKENEQYIQNGPVCQTTCATLNTPCPKIAPATPINACYCIDGYARDQDGICVATDTQECQDLLNGQSPPIVARGPRPSAPAPLPPAPLPPNPPPQGSPQSQMPAPQPSPQPPQSSEIPMPPPSSPESENMFPINLPPSSSSTSFVPGIGKIIVRASDPSVLSGPVSVPPGLSSLIGSGPGVTSTTKPGAPESSSGPPPAPPVPESPVSSSQQVKMSVNY